MRILRIASIAVLLTALFAAFKLSRTGYESPDYRVEKEDGPFEIRQYPSMLLASTPMSTRNPEDDGSFMRLFRYISSANAAEQKISMTTPVLMTEEDGGGQMSFIAPRDLATAGAPPATDEQVSLETMDGGRFAAYRFSGRLEPGRVDEAEQRLIAWTEQQGLKSVGQPIAVGASSFSMAARRAVRTRRHSSTRAVA